MIKFKLNFFICFYENSVSMCQTIWVFSKCAKIIVVFSEIKNVTKRLISLFLVLMYTAELIEELISCPKTVGEAPRDMKEGRSGFTKRTFTLISVDGQHNFSGFITQNLTFTENFSIGLIYNPQDEKSKIVLLRCNGPHGGIKEIPHHAVCHIHTSTHLLQKGLITD